MSETMTDNQRSFDACDRFFSIHEMVSYFLHTAPPLVLLKCHRVCKLWNEIISDSEICQQNLFLEPVERDDAEGPMVPRLNPILWECFGPVLACGTSKNKPDSQPCSYEDLLKLPWARDGDSMDAPARLAYARGEASWREMLVSQPPIRRLDWWHYWRTEDEESNAQYSMQDVPRGWGHQDSNGSSVTIGMLWDLIEARLKRGCQAQVLYFPKGSSVHEDETAGEVEREWEIDGSNQHRGFTTTLPRVKILTNHAWPGVEPEKCMKFSIEEDTWVRLSGDGHAPPDEEQEDLEDGNGEQEALNENRTCRCPRYEGDGFNWMRHDCRRDVRENHERWSMAEEMRWTEIDGESSMFN